MSTLSPLSLFTFILVSIAVVQATVPPSQTFKFINQGFFEQYDAEYGASYREFPRFSLCFYSTTPNAYMLALRMGSRIESSMMRWVWEANPGNPVGENASLTFGADGNLVLAHANGRVAWQTSTCNKGVVELKLLPNLNLVLVDSQGRYVWQSFNYPTNTLMAGQELRVGGPIQLVSRVSDKNARYTFVMEKQRLAMYLKTRNTPKPILYHAVDQDNIVFRRIVFTTSLEDIAFYFYIENATSPEFYLIAIPKYNCTLSFLRLESDGNLKTYTFYDNGFVGTWDVTYSLFGDDVSECKLPAKCGSLGVCRNNQCVGCPTPKGLLWWDEETCAPPELPLCKKGVPLPKVKYYKVVGVEHFTSEYTEGEGPVKVSECKVRCSNDCGCLGFFYREESSKCLVTYELGTLTKVSNQTHVAYIKMSK